MPSPVIAWRKATPHRRSTWRSVQIGAALLLACGLADAAEATELRNSDPDSGLMLYRDAGTTAHPALRLETAVRIQVSGIVARVEVVQRFENTADAWLEGVYVCPLPENASVDTLSIDVGGRKIVGEVREKSQAVALYQQASASGRRAGLVEQRRPNLFRTRIANIGPYEQVAVAIGYQQVIDQQAGEFRLRLPLAVTPRYRPEPVPAEQSATAGNRSALEDAPTAPPFAPPDPSRHRVTVEVLLDAGVAIDDLRSHFHAVDAVDLGSHYRITLQDRVAPDRDFELSWRPRVGAEPEPAVFLEEFHGRVHALVTLMPPPAMAAPAAPRELVFVIDTSGSMEGASLQQAKAALLLALDRLGQQDRFNVIQFNSEAETLYQQSVAATTRNKRAAVQYVMALRAHGGTEMAPALRTAFRLPRPADGLRQVIFITDGAVSNERELFDLIEAQLGSARLFTVGIGSAPNGHLMRRAARSGRGTHTFVASSDQVHERMTELFERIERPVVTDIRIDWPGAPTAETAPSVLPDLYAGEPIVATARLDPGASGLITITGQDGTGHWTHQVALPSRGIEHEGIARTWARERIDDLLGLEHAAADPAPVRRAIVDLALEYQLTSPHTSLVAIAPDPVRPAGAPIENAAVASPLPAGMAANLVIDAFPRTATAAPLHLAIGLCAVVLGLLTLLAGRRLS